MGHGQADFWEAGDETFSSPRVLGLSPRSGSVKGGDGYKGD